MLIAAPGAHADISPGQGSASAQSLAVAPHDGSLAVGVVLGEALAGHTNGVARAQSQGIDLGAIGTSLTGYNCGSQSFQPDQIPQPLNAETGQPGADSGISQQPDPSKGSSQPSFGSNEFVKATGTPYGEADTSFASTNANGFSVAGMSTKAWSGLVDGQREAGAVSDIASLNLANGLVKLGGLHWESVYPSGGSVQPHGTFSMGSLEIAGTPVPTNQSLSALQSAINTALGTVGLEVLLPQSSVNQGVQSVSPLQIEAVPNDTRDNIVNVPLNATESQQQQLFGGLENGVPGEPTQLVQALCQSDTPITVAQIAIASVNGGGYLSAGLGGVSSSSSDVKVNPYSLNLLGPISLGGGTTLGAAGDTPDSSSLVGATDAGSGAGALSGGASGTPAGLSPSVAGSAPVGGSAGTVGGGAAAAPSSGSQISTSPAASVHYAAGGPLLAIGLAGLGLLGLLAEADRRMMRRAQYTVHFQE